MSFGGEIFNDIVDRASDIFDTLPPPEPSLANAQSRPVTLSAYNDPNGGCFDSNCQITMADGSSKVLKNIVKGDLVKSVDLNNNISSTKVVCVLEIKITMGIREFVDFEEGLFITPWHPIKYNENWVFPADIKAPIIRSCNSIITLVLENNHIAYINGYQCIMLGHGYTDGVLNHPYYGTQLIIEDMKKNYGWSFGKVVIKDNAVEFIKTNNVITKMNYTSIKSRPSLVEVDAY